MDFEAAEAWIRSWGAWGYVAIALGTLWDHSGLSVFLVAGGAISQLTGELNIFLVAAAGMVGYVVSDMLFYALGRWRADWLERVVRSEKGRARLQVLAEEMNKWALPILALGRFVPWLGRFIPAAGGLRRVPWTTALAAFAAGGYFGGLLYGMLGFFFASLFVALQEDSVWLLIVSIIVSLPVAWFVVRYFNRRVEALVVKRSGGPDAAEEDEASD